jgi:hypothetical protein
VNGEGGYFGGNSEVGYSYYVRPIVCIETSVFNEKYSESLEKK